jgi:DNA-binding NarL/FixJ family response regulator
VKDLKRALLIPEDQKRLDRIAFARGKLTPRQLEIARYVPQGLTNKQIAAKLNITVQTVKYHMAEILKRLNIATCAGSGRNSHILFRYLGGNEL